MLQKKTKALKIVIIDRPMLKLMEEIKKICRNSGKKMIIYLNKYFNYKIVIKISTWFYFLIEKKTNFIDFAKNGLV